MKAFTLIFITFFIASCKEANKETPSIQKEEISEIKSETHTMLQGIWLNKDDTLSAIRFEGNTSTNSYKGVDSGKEIFFTVDSNCAGSENVAPAEEGSYINTTGFAEECYFIENLTETDLTIKLVSENISLQFRRK